MPSGVLCVPERVDAPSMGMGLSVAIVFAWLVAVAVIKAAAFWFG